MAEEDNKSQIFLVERRRKERFIVNVPVEVTFDKGGGEIIAERTFIEDVSDLGCRFTARAPAQPGETVTLKVLGPVGNKVPNEEPRQYEIMWVVRNGRHSTVGARLITGEKLLSVETSLEAQAQDHKAK